ncbi:MAG: hypothetical protein BWK80_24205 [Desulfobacteraceae bacterium IS3]|nr:MAG: hypothetical protein BWK80_24205 [Desulfobacteraceae bacterium IS3]
MSVSLSFVMQVRAGSVSDRTYHKLSLFKKLSLLIRSLTLAARIFSAIFSMQKIQHHNFHV